LFGSKLKYKLGAKKVDGIHPCLSVIHPWWIDVMMDLVNAMHWMFNIVVHLKGLYIKEIAFSFQTLRPTSDSHGLCGNCHCNVSYNNIVM
jgi:hypothetical protein